MKAQIIQDFVYRNIRLLPSAKGPAIGEFNLGLDLLRSLGECGHWEHIGLGSRNQQSIRFRVSVLANFVEEGPNSVGANRSLREQPAPGTITMGPDHLRARHFSRFRIIDSDLPLAPVALIDKGQIADLMTR